MNKAIKALYLETFSCVNLHGYFTKLFEKLIGNRQGDNCQFLYLIYFKMTLHMRLSHKILKLEI